MDDIRNLPPGSDEPGGRAGRYPLRVEHAAPALIDAWTAQDGSSLDFYGQLMDEHPRADQAPFESTGPVSEETARFQAEHRATILAWNAWLDEHGMPCDDLRRG